MTVGLLSFVSLVSASGLSQRSVLNVNFVSGTNDYAFIDHTKSGGGFWGPYGAAYGGTDPTFSSLLDANGWAAHSTASNPNYGGGFEVPDPANFNGPYILDCDGTGTINQGLQFPITATGTFTVGNGSNGMPAPVNGTVSIVAGGFQFFATGGASKASCQFTFTSTETGPQGLNTVITAIDATHPVKNVRIYRAADATDLANGLIFRRPWKQSIVSHCPSALRFMDWIGGNQCRNNRWENRTLPGNASYSIGNNWVASPNYQTNATGNNQTVVPAATPTASNTQNTPVSMVHGEFATFRIPSTGGGQRCQSSLTVTAITNGANGRVTTSVAHGYSTGDIIGHYFGPIQGVGATLNSSTTVTNINNASIVIGMFVFGPGIPANTTVSGINAGLNQITLSNAATISANVNLGFRSMFNLHLFPCTITVVDATHYDLNVNTTSMGTFITNGSTTVYSYQFQTLQVGSGSDRTGYPCMSSGGGLPFSLFGNFLPASSYFTAYFDKTLSGQTDGSGNPVMGVWLMDGVSAGHAGDVPVEICVALVNELNAMSPAHTIGMWLNLPTWGLYSMDPNYSSASNWATNCMDAVLNPSSTVRASGYSALGYSGLTKLNSPVLIVEYANEPWNGTDVNGYLGARSNPRWPTIYAYGGSFQDMLSLRSTCAVRDIKAAIPSLLSNTKFTLGVHGTQGMGNNGLSSNYAIAFGGTLGTPILSGSWYTNDTLVTTGSWGRPIDNHDGVNPATYFDPYDSYYTTTTGTGCFTDDSAMYNGQNNTANGGGNYTGAANQTQAIANFIAAVTDTGNAHASESIYRYQTSVYPQFATQIQTAGANKIVISYEGGADWSVANGASIPGGNLTSAQSTFSLAVLNSSQWATAQTGFFNTISAINGVYMPAIFIFIQGGSGSGQTNQRWAYCLPDSYASVAGTPTEGQALLNNPAWAAMSSRNVALPS